MNFRHLTTYVSILFLIQPCLPGGEVRTEERREVLKRRLEQFGVGTDLNIRLAGGHGLRGTVESIGSESFVVAPKGNGPQREIDFRDLSGLSYPKRGYKSEGAQDPDAAKRMVVQLGVGEHIMVQVGPTRKLRGHIREIRNDGFLLQPDGEAATVPVAYNSILKVNKNLSFGATIAILAAIAAAVVLILVLSGEEDIDVLPG